MQEEAVIGAIAGDIIGSPYEHARLKQKEFPLFGATSRFTDDTVMTVAVAAAVLGDRDYREQVRRFGRRHPRAGYGQAFQRWLQADDPSPYGSWGNGSAMRVAPVGFAFDTEEDVLREAKTAAAITHDHPEGIRGAQATALAVLLARRGESKDAIRRRISKEFGYDLYRSVDEIRPGYDFDVSCQGSVPEAIIAFLDAHCWEDAVRNAVSLGGDADTMACIAGGIAEAHYGMPEAVRAETLARLPHDLLEVVMAFEARYLSRR